MCVRRILTRVSARPPTETSTRDRSASPVLHRAAPSGRSPEVVWRTRVGPSGDTLSVYAVRPSSSTCLTAGWSTCHRTSYTSTPDPATHFWVSVAVTCNVVWPLVLTRSFRTVWSRTGLACCLPDRPGNPGPWVPPSPRFRVVTRSLGGSLLFPTGGRV